MRYPLPIDFASMTDLEDPHLACRIVNSIKDPIIAHANPPAGFQSPPQHLDPRWTGDVRQGSNCCVDPLDG